MRVALANLLVILLFAPALSAQMGSLRIIPKEITYERKPADGFDNRRLLTVTYPIIKSKLPLKTKKNLRHTLSYWRAFNTTLKQEMEMFYTYNIEYKTTLNQHNILSLVFTQGTVGAYPDHFERYIVADLRNGKQLRIKDLFKRSKLNSLLLSIRKEIRKREDMRMVESDCFSETIKMNRESDVSGEHQPVPENIRYKDLSGFIIEERGVSFIYDYSFPHVAEDCEPEREYLLTWNQLKPFIKRKGLLAKFVR